MNMSIDDQPPSERQQRNSSTAAANFRDRFLQNLQTVLQASAAGALLGMKSAWQDIDAATGFGNKLKHILPDTAMTDMVQQSGTGTKGRGHRCCCFTPSPTHVHLGRSSPVVGQKRVLPDVHVEDYDDDDSGEHHYRAPRVVAAPPQLYNKPVTAAAINVVASV
jgi:hypothetical protein